MRDNPDRLSAQQALGLLALLEELFAVQASEAEARDLLFLIETKACRAQDLPAMLQRLRLLH